MSVALAVIAAAVVVFGFSTYLILTKAGRPQSDEPGVWRAESNRQHAEVPTQTWAAFLTETYRKQRNSGAHVKLGGGFEIGIVGESFHLPELQWIRSQDSDPNRYRTRFLAYLVPEPENPFSRHGNAVRIESPRGKTIGHLSAAHADQYAAVFKELGAQQRTGVCSASACGGTDRKPNIGVWIRIDHAAWLTEQIVEAQQPPRPRQKRQPQSFATPDQPF